MNLWSVVANEAVDSRRRSSDPGVGFANQA